MTATWLLANNGKRLMDVSTKRWRLKQWTSPIPPATGLPLLCIERQGVTSYAQAIVVREQKVGARRVVQYDGIFGHSVVVYSGTVTHGWLSQSRKQADARFSQALSERTSAG